jgi:hypothetical protein
MTQTTASAAKRSLIKADYTRFSPSKFCQAGQVPNSAGDACEVCATNAFKQMAGFAKCVACPAGTFSNADGTQCKPLAFCPPSTTLDGVTGDDRFDVTKCTSCADADYKSGPGPAACGTCTTAAAGVNDARTKCAGTVATTCSAPLAIDPTDKAQCYIP